MASHLGRISTLDNEATMLDHGGVHLFLMFQFASSVLDI